MQRCRRGYWEATEIMQYHRTPNPGRLLPPLNLKGRKEGLLLKPESLSSIKKSAQEELSPLLEGQAARLAERELGVGINTVMPPPIGLPQAKGRKHVGHRERPPAQ